MIENVTIGTDIEMFVQDRQTGEIVSAEGYARGTKKDPYVFDPSSKFFATSLDNVLFEFCIPPARTVEEFLNHIKKSKDFVGSQLPPHLCVISKASARLAPQFLETENAMNFGCEVDYNAWTRSQNEPPQPDSSLRSAGFHVHVGYDNPGIDTAEALVRAMDQFLGVPSVLIDPDVERRALYGRAGSFRPKQYGFEYRVLSGYFASSDHLVQWVYESTMKAIEFVNNGGTAENCETIIDFNMKARADRFVKRHNIVLP
jgi:hypothetical protein